MYLYMNIYIYVYIFIHIYLPIEGIRTQHLRRPSGARRRAEAVRAAHLQPDAAGRSFRRGDSGLERLSATVDSRKLEYGTGKIYGGFPSFRSFGIGGRSYSNFLASTVTLDIH